MSIFTLIILILILGIFFSYPGWNHSRDFGFGPFGGLIGLILLLLILRVFGLI